MKDRNRYKDIYQTIPEGCDWASQLYKSQAAETPDKDTRGWTICTIWGWLTAETSESCGRQLRGGSVL